MNSVNIRKLAVSILTEAEAAEKYINLAVSSHSLDRLTREERASLTALVYTVTERRITYDYVIAALASREQSSIDPYTLNLLRVGVCQILSMRSIPDFAAVNETVKLARNPGERAFVNAVLRAAVRKKDDPPLPPPEKNYKRFLSVKYSFPLATVKLFDKLFGKEDTERLLRFFNEEKYTDLTVNTTRISVADFAKNLADGGYSPTVDPDTGMSVRLRGSVNPERLPGFAEGHFFVQDKASLVSALALGASAGDSIMDVCSAPGGKSFAVGVLSANSARILSSDLHASKLSLITDGAKRLGLDSITVSEGDASIPCEQLFESADKIICDAPCSGLGVLGKKPDLRYKDRTRVAEISDLQYKILENSSKYLKRGGRMVYSTCTLDPAENGNIIDRFLISHPDFRAVDFSVGSLASECGRLTLLPHVHATDGFFISLLERTTD